MASTYDIQQYLLDRADIHDTVTTLSFFLDTLNIDGIVAEVFAKEVHVDFTKMLGGEPFATTGVEWAKTLGDLARTNEATQHVTTGIVIGLSRPGSGSRPSLATVDAQFIGNMLKAGNNMAQYGGLLRAELSRDAELEKQGVNP